VQKRHKRWEYYDGELKFPYGVASGDPCEWARRRGRILGFEIMPHHTVRVPYPVALPFALRIVMGVALRVGLQTPPRVRI
jgi:hypothetical protein